MAAAAAAGRGRKRVQTNEAADREKESKGSTSCRLQRCQPGFTLSLEGGPLKRQNSKDVRLIVISKTSDVRTAGSGWVGGRSEKRLSGRGGGGQAIDATTAATASSSTAISTMEIGKTGMGEQEVFLFLLFAVVAAGAPLNTTYHSLGGQPVGGSVAGEGRASVVQQSAPGWMDGWMGEWVCLTVSQSGRATAESFFLACLLACSRVAVSSNCWEGGRRTASTLPMGEALGPSCRASAGK